MAKLKVTKLKLKVLYPYLWKPDAMNIIVTSSATVELHWSHKFHDVHWCLSSYHFLLLFYFTRWSDRSTTSCRMEQHYGSEMVPKHQLRGVSLLIFLVLLTQSLWINSFLSSHIIDYCAIIVSNDRWQSLKLLGVATICFFLFPRITPWHLITLFTHIFSL